MSMSIDGGRRHGATAEINITPLIDVVLVLLIIFMVLLPTTMKRLTATLPRQDETASPSTSEQILVKIGPEAQLTLNGESIEPSSLKQRLAERLGSDAQKVVFFEIDDDARYDALVRFLDLAKGAGARTLAIVSPPPAR